MTKCAACNRECRKTTLALVLPDHRTRRVCHLCARLGLLVVSTLQAPIIREASRETPALDLCTQQVRAWSRAVQVKTGVHDLQRDVQLECYEQFHQLLQRARELVR